MVSYLCHHMDTTHVIVLLYNMEVDVEGGGTETYMVFFPQVLKLVACLVDGCPSRSNHLGRLIEHFIYRHWKLEMAMIQEGTKSLPKCDHCLMHIPADHIIKHRWTAIFNKATEMWLRQRDLEMAERCREIYLSLYG